MFQRQALWSSPWSLRFALFLLFVGWGTLVLPVQPYWPSRRARNPERVLLGIAKICAVIDRASVRSAAISNRELCFLFELFCETLRVTGRAMRSRWLSLFSSRRLSCGHWVSQGMGSGRWRRVSPDIMDSWISDSARVLLSI